SVSGNTDGRWRRQGLSGDANSSCGGEHVLQYAVVPDEVVVERRRDMHANEREQRPHCDLVDIARGQCPTRLRGCNGWKREETEYIDGKVVRRRRCPAEKRAHEQQQIEEPVQR